ncbi:hypothetical protein EAG_05088 [Camponotus floridanus]|uniref:Uncharacterized protein n=1 Tax=Camponotus floridanus TaxID=104421 RepID=E2AEE4_CAMFO|nr:uncharacterized protein LOC105251490 [Camponotus floridanus]EFN68196.1 hypothetical protein EAG_05088 [Camponotus floridanus]
MTLHWWMHWFWVTAQFLVILGSPLPSSTSDPINQQSQSSSRTTSPSIETEHIYRSSKSPRPSFRIAKAIGFYPQTNTAVVADRQPVTTVASSLLESRGSTGPGTTGHEDIDESSFRGNISGVLPLGVTTPAQHIIERIRNPTTKKDSKITWILTTSKSSGRSKPLHEERYNQSSGAARNVSFDEVEDLTVLPLQEEMTKIDLSLNRTRSSPLMSLSAAGATSNVAIRTMFNRSEDESEIDEEVAQTQHFATAASILEVGVSESTRLSRARDTFITQHFQRDQMQGDNRSSDYTDKAEQQNSGTSAAGIAAITGSCLATVLLLSTMGSLGFIIYRRKYLNPPQTLNSDKCSNPDSSGYIDDSTIRDNSEEMYSLDNDSFLNSLEAMTIQNYWTDSVKHTKL